MDERIAGAPIEALALSKQLTGKLRRLGYERVGVLTGLSRSDLLALKGIGAKAADALIAALQAVADSDASRPLIPTQAVH